MSDICCGKDFWKTRQSIPRPKISQLGSSRGIETLRKKRFMEMKDAVELMLAQDRSLDGSMLQPYERS
jgi:hypothetical protein